MKSSGLSCSIWRFTAISMVAALALVFSLVAVIMPANPAMADTITVINLNDSGDGSLRWAIANATAGDTIDFTVAGTITLASQLTINKSLTITGPGEANLAISGGNTSRVFYVDNLGVCIVSMSGMTIRNGNTSADGGGIYNDGGNVTMTSCTVSGNTANQSGGGIYKNGGEVRMTDCTVSGNTAVTGNGGGIVNNGSGGDGVTMTDCTVSDNKAENGNGGGIYSYDELTMTNCTVSGNEAINGGGIYNSFYLVEMTDCTVSGNTASNSGGGIYNDDDMTMTNCTVSGNTAEGVSSGGGIYNSGVLMMTNCTVSGNTSDEGGGIFSNDELTLINCTISNNTALGGDSGGGIYIGGESDATLTCTIVYGNTPDDIDGGYTDAGENIVGDPDGDPDPLLGPLQDNGGPTFTHALLTGSPAIDACIVSCNLTTDQRGQPRPVDGDLSGSAFCDVGAYEYQQQPVGGIVEPVDKLSLLAPWLGLAALMAVAITIAVVVRRRMA